MKNLFTFWSGPKPNIISILEYRMEEACLMFGYKFHPISSNNIESYIELPKNFEKLRVQHKSDVARVRLINKYGGIWFDSDTLVLGNLDKYFKKIEENEGFFLRNSEGKVINANFGSRPETSFMQKWSKKIDDQLKNGAKFPYETIGNEFLSREFASGELSSYDVSCCENLEAPIRKGRLLEYTKPNEKLKKQILENNPSFLVLQNPIYRHYSLLSQEEKRISLLFSLLKEPIV